MTAAPRRVLLVEDSRADIELTLEALEGASVVSEVTVVRDGAAALLALRDPTQQRPDLVILDLNLPRVNGHEVLDCMQRDKELRCIPVAVLTTSSAERDVARSYELGGNCFLAKPVDVDDYVNVVRAVDEFWLGLVRVPQVPR